MTKDDIARSVKQIGQVAKVALADPHGDRLLFDVLHKNQQQLKFNVVFLPEELSIGFKTTAYKTFSEEQKIFLNHLIYYIHYFRITGAERVAIQNNIALADSIDSTNVAKYLLLETKEELDHIKTFSMIMAGIATHYELGTSHLKNKVAHIFSTNQYFLRFMLKSFGPDYVLTYFISRGIFNHMGYGFESAVASGADHSSPVKELTKLHIIDEKRHMVISNLFSQTAREFLPSTSLNKAMMRIYSPLENIIIKGSFSESYTKKIEYNLALSLLIQCKLFSSWSVNEVECFLKEHYGQITGVEEVKNKVMQPQNNKLLDKSALSEQDKIRWRNTLEENCGFLEFFSNKKMSAEKVSA